MHEIAMTTVLAAGKGGGKIAIAVLLIVIVLLIVGWAVYAGRVRASRAKKQ